ncbi:low choriolytic enzyme-like [Colossoma macropomum]|uniref:low choriolytic enzyme-like n=1 Tax=Colossoma macropomum TaxID=42526 RepID=UPI001864E4A1|nr:low choriolytic enzyme-like [Colossoma macropomum]
MHLTLALILLLLGISPAQSRSIKTSLKESPEETDNNTEEEYLSVSDLIERANKNIEESQDGLTIKFGDIVVEDGLQNADKCTSGQPGCKWPREKDKKVYVPYQISNHYGLSEKRIIKDALRSFEKPTCIRFIPRTQQKDYLQIMSDRGCYSYVGRIGGEQILSLQRDGCIYKHVIQHELLHALGFHHEQCRSDRDKHIKILKENILPGMEYSFDKHNTNNLGTPYDYGSVMHYGRYAFSKNGQPTMIPIPNPNVKIGLSTEMNANDILRVNKLYCK